MDQHRAWVYSGGVGLAGFHMEDGGARFINISLLLSLNLEKEHELTRRVLEKMLEIARCWPKQWIFYPSR
jgi:hypothetical protein